MARVAETILWRYRGWVANGAVDREDRHIAMNRLIPEGASRMAANIAKLPDLLRSAKKRPPSRS
jgi:hypothetical protein